MIAIPRPIPNVQSLADENRLLTAQQDRNAEDTRLRFRSTPIPNVRLKDQRFVDGQWVQLLSESEFTRMAEALWIERGHSGQPLLLATTPSPKNF